MSFTDMSKIVLPIPIKAYVCPYCREVFDSQKECREHIDAKHENAYSNLFHVEVAP